MARRSPSRPTYTVSSIWVPPSYSWLWLGLVSEWLVINAFHEARGTRAVARMRARVMAEIDTTFASHYSSKSTLRDAMTVEAIAQYVGSKDRTKNTADYGGSIPLTA